MKRLMPIGRVLARGVGVLLCCFRAVGIAANDEVY